MNFTKNGGPLLSLIGKRALSLLCQKRGGPKNSEGVSVRRSPTRRPRRESASNGGWGEKSVWAPGIKTVLGGHPPKNGGGTLLMRGVVQNLVPSARFPFPLVSRLSRFGRGENVTRLPLLGKNSRFPENREKQKPGEGVKVGSGASLVWALLPPVGDPLRGPPRRPSPRALPSWVTWGGGGKDLPILGGPGWGSGVVGQTGEGAPGRRATSWLGPFSQILRGNHGGFPGGERWSPSLDGSGPRAGPLSPGGEGHRRRALGPPVKPPLPPSSQTWGGGGKRVPNYNRITMKSVMRRNVCSARTEGKKSFGWALPFP